MQVSSTINDDVSITATIRLSALIALKNDLLYILGMNVGLLTESLALLGESLTESIDPGLVLRDVVLGDASGDLVMRQRAETNTFMVFS